MDLNSPKTLITGHRGMVGTYLLQLLPRATVIDIDLREYLYVLQEFIHGEFDYVFHLAARVGGLGANMNGNQEFYEDNVRINTNVLSAAARYKVKKLISVLSTCIYPDDVEYPLTEDQLHNGFPHRSNYGYAYAKRMMEVHTQILAEQGHDFMCVIPNNLIGKYDNFHLENSHVVPAIIRKMHEAKLRGDSGVTLWGDGSPLREFTYAGDIAKIMVMLMQKPTCDLCLNIGNTVEHSIQQVAECIKMNLQFEGEIVWDTSKPNGQYRKPSDDTLLRKNGWSAQVFMSFPNAIAEICEWFVKNYPKVRGVV